MPHSDGTPTPSAYASIMVLMDIDKPAERRAALAVSLADRFSSRLIGATAQQTMPPLYFESPSPSTPSIVELEERRVADEFAKAEAAFRRATGTRNLVEWRQAATSPTGYILRQARAADLMVAGRPPHSDSTPRRMGIDCGDLVMNAGRPVLFVPPHVDQLWAKRVVIGWNETREARRAIWDSLPLLKTAKDVFVVSVDSEDIDDTGANDVAAYLACHGVNVSARGWPAPARAVADELIRIAESESADLIVCGAYGHSRAREWVLGGVTRDLLDHASMCCLMAH
jgi:nucleotide-binding universal stress UspA family protein